MKHLKIYLMLLGFSIFTGATFNLAKYTLDYFSASSAAAWRFGLAAVMMLIILAVTQGVKLAHLKANAIPYVVLGIVGIFGFNALFFVGLEYTSPLNGALIMGTNPLLTTVLARLILKDPITKRQIIGIFFALVGVLLVITQGSLEIIKGFILFNRRFDYFGWKLVLVALRSARTSLCEGEQLHGDNDLYDDYWGN